MSQRESGFYWVKLDDNWEVAGYHQPTISWVILDNHATFGDDIFAEIDERRIVRGE